jgi:hypothetical protein
MRLQSKLSTRSIIAILAASLALTVPTVASAHFFFNWWLRPSSSPIEDVSFETVTASRSRLYDVFFLNHVFEDFVKTSLLDQTLTASVASEQLTISTFTLTDGNGTSAVVTVPTLDLTTDLFGSSFRSNVTIDVTTPSDSYSATGRIFGRITEVSGEYKLRASIGGLSLEDLGSGSVVYHLLRTSLSGTTSVP